MKTRYLILALLITLFSSCKDNEDYRDVIYFSGTETSPAVKITIEGPAQLGVIVRSSTIVDNDVKVNLKVKPELLKEYNEKYGKNYEFLPEGSFSLSADFVVIESGKYASNAIQLDINSIDNFQDGTTYCVPIAIEDVEGGYPVLESSRVMYAVIGRTIITQAASLASSQYFRIPFTDVPELSSIPKVTMEARIYINSFQANSPFISSIMGIEEHFLLRFGDVKVDPNKMQLAGGAYQLASPTSVPTNQWVHVAVTYDGAKISIYYNGKLNATTDAPRGPLDFAEIGKTNQQGFFIGRSENGRYLNGAISECRIWTRALSANELANNLCYVNPTSEGLLAYWRFNDAENTVVTDLTGNGYHAKAARSITWVTGVRCPE